MGKPGLMLLVMASEASTGRGGAKRRRKGPMRRLFLLVLLLGFVVVAVGMVMLGTFPPNPHVQTIQKVLPNDRFTHAS